MNINSVFGLAFWMLLFGAATVYCQWDKNNDVFIKRGWLDLT